MAETPSPQSPSGIQPRSGLNDGSSLYWCYQCHKRVPVEALAGEVVCYECKAGFVGNVPAAAVPVPTPDDAEAAAALIDRPNFGYRLIQVLRLLSQVARAEDEPPLPQSSDGDNHRVELNRWDRYNEDDDEYSVEVVDGEFANNRNGSTENNRSYGEAEWETSITNEEEEEVEDEDDLEMRRQRDILRLRVTDLISRAAGRRRRILNWAEFQLGMDDHPIEFTLESPDSQTYIGNPGDFFDTAGYEALLQNLADSDNFARRGAPPAAKSAIEGLENLVIENEDKAILCAICKDSINVGESGKNLPCGHGYHGDCIFPWLGTRNSCPLCRFELPTDDPEYEEERKKRAVATGVTVASSSSSGAGCGGA